ncbi:hypothetical protein [Mucilaginibacter celer]|uniref:Fibronectin type-III domain-containing protein n=1 Tax=Mucilaginibacter celer TaxID=2305508 RepID=A0A494VMT0_9SPHI|nr:hypothetical protein [Mucilaginibacter celer]AYL95429.1 hypothetical protein HYN43_009040 [Mucilaginibacter celer]
MRKVIFFFFSIAILSACGSHKTDNPAPPPPPAGPGKPTLIAPASNEVCTQGTVISATQSTVTLKWSAADNATGYDVTIKNLDDGTSASLSTAATQVNAILKRNTPYSWTVSAKSAAAATSKSDTWKFYNSGPATVNYAPFPAEIVAPVMNQTVTVTNGKMDLSWNGSDADNDTILYDIYFGDSSSPALLKNKASENILKDVAVVAGKTYYWKVITTDSKGNTSDSGIYKFTTK